MYNKYRRYIVTECIFTLDINIYNYNVATTQNHTYSNSLFFVDTIPTSISLGLKSTARTCDKHDMAN